MGILDDREKAQENKYFHDEEMRFKVLARRNRLFGLWVANKLGLQDAEADTYAVEVVKSDMQEPGDADVIRKVEADLKAKGTVVPAAELQATLEGFLDEAVRQIQNEK
jgi:hypothetical protein